MPMLSCLSPRNFANHITILLCSLKILLGVLLVWNHSNSPFLFLCFLQDIFGDHTKGRGRNPDLLRTVLLLEPVEQEVLWVSSFSSRTLGIFPMSESGVT